MKKICILLLSLFVLTGCYDRFDEGYDNGYDNGKIDGYNEGYHDGYDEGEYAGYQNGYSDCYDDGEAGYADGYIQAYLDLVEWYESPDYFDYRYIPLKNVTSSFVDSVGYSPTHRVLLMGMNGSNLYAYFDVPDSVFYGLLTAESVGSYFNEHVKDVYEYEKIY